VARLRASRGEAMSQRIGLFGGRFDPIHFGHLISARSIAERLSLSRIVLIPCARPPHRPAGELTDAASRLEMARLAVQDDPLFESSDLEIHRPGPSYTFDTVTQFRTQTGPEADLFWIIGADSLPELPTWYRVADLVRLVQIVTVTRPGCSPPPRSTLVAALGEEPTRGLLAHCYATPAIEISATDIRARVRSGRSIRYLTPEPVRSYIESRGLYIS